MGLDPQRMAGELRWTTESVSVDDQFEYFCQSCSRNFFGMQQSLPQEHVEGFQASVGVRPFSSGAVSHVEAAPVRVTRNKRDVARSPIDPMFLYLQTQGVVLTRQPGREAILRPGDLALFDPMIPFELDYATAHQVFSVQIPRGLVTRFIAKPKDSTLVRLNGSDNSLGSLLSKFVRELGRASGPYSGTEHAVLEHVTGLAALALGATGTGAEAGRIGLKASLRAAALRYIALELDNPALTPTAVARHLRISVRYLHYLFAQHDASVERWILQCRLDRACELLLSAKPGELTVSEVASRCGFTDLSHFSRAFRHRHGMRPRDLLAAYPIESLSPYLEAGCVPSNTPQPGRPRVERLPSAGDLPNGV